MQHKEIVVLKSDPFVGLHAHVSPPLAKQVCEQLVSKRVRFAADPREASHLAAPDRTVLVFGAQHPVGVRQDMMTLDASVEIDPAVVLTETTYRPPLDALLRLGDPNDEDAVFDYDTLGIGREHVPELIRMTTDEGLHTAPSDSPIVWAPLHAWRQLGELRAEEAVGPLLGLLRLVNEDDWVVSEVPGVLADIGPASLEPAAAYLADPTHDEWPRVAAAEAIGQIGQRFDELRETCIARLTGQLQFFAAQSAMLNAFLILPLLNLGAVQAAPVMEQAFAAGLVDEDVQGDWEDVQVQLGLKMQREGERKPTRRTRLEDRFVPQWDEVMEEQEEDLTEPPEIPWATHLASPKIGRNEPCPCGSGKKYKKCCGG